MLQQVGRYKVLRQLGKGAMGVVYLADDPLLSRQVAIKTIDLGVEDANSREFLRARLLRDARAAASLSHPHIVGIYDVVVEGDCACVVMEYVAGEDLSAYLSRRPIADPQFTVQVIRAMAGALDYTHSRGIIHRDIKPANVMLDAANIPKITDFGIARITEGASTTMTGTVMGTIEYMAPEQVKGEALDGRADQFALGVVAYRMLTGSTLYGNQSIATLAYKIVNEAPASVRSRNGGLPAGVDAAVAKALAKIPADRYRNCAEFAEALASSMTSLDRDATTAAMPAAAARKSGNRTAVAAIALSAAAGAIAGVLVWKPWLQPASERAAAPTVEKASVEKALVEKTTATKAVAKARAAPVERVDDAGTDAPAAPDDTPKPAGEAYNRGRDLLTQQQYAGAAQAFTKATEIRPNWALAYSSRGNAYKHLEQIDAAIRDYSQAIRLNPKMYNAYLERGECHLRQKQDNPAFDDFNQALSLKPDAPLALMGRAGIYLRRKAYHKAVADFDEAIRLSPELANAYRGRANARRALGDAAGGQADDQKYKELSAGK